MELYNLSVLILGELPSNLTILYGLFTFILGVVAVLIYYINIKINRG